MVLIFLACFFRGIFFCFTEKEEGGIQTGFFGQENLFSNCLYLTSLELSIHYSYYCSQSFFMLNPMVYGFLKFYAMAHYHHQFRSSPSDVFPHPCKQSLSISHHSFSPNPPINKPAANARCKGPQNTQAPAHS